MKTQAQILEAYLKIKEELKEISNKITFGEYGADYNDDDLDNQHELEQAVDIYKYILEIE